MEVGPSSRTMKKGYFPWSSNSLWCKPTLNMIFSATYYLVFHNAISIFSYASYFTNKCEIAGLDIIEHEQLYMVKNSIDSEKRYSTV